MPSREVSNPVWTLYNRLIHNFELLLKNPHTLLKWHACVFKFHLVLFIRYKICKSQPHTRFWIQKLVSAKRRTKFPITANNLIPSEYELSALFAEPIISFIKCYFIISTKFLIHFASFSFTNNFVFVLGVIKFFSNCLQSRFNRKCEASQITLIHQPLSSNKLAKLQDLTRFWHLFPFSNLPLFSTLKRKNDNLESSHELLHGHLC